MSALLERLREALSSEYRVERELGGGGMGLVFLAYDLTLERPVAVKVMRPELATAQAAERFLAESRILANLHHPNVVPVHDAGEAGGLFYYVMDYVEGETLADRLARSPLSRREAIKLGRDLLDGLEAAHRARVVHRDINPSNILLVGDRAMLTDFGIAKPVAGKSDARTAPGAPMGTPGYMPPEQAAGYEVTPGADLYAAAVVLYQAFTGRQWSYAQRADWDGVPRSVARVLRQALAWLPEDRWSDARAFRRALWRTRTAPYVRRTIALTLLGLVAGTAFGIMHRRAVTLPPATLAVLPFEVEGEADRALGSGLARLTVLHLEGVPALSLTPTLVGFAVWDSLRVREGEASPAWASALRASRWTRATVVPEGDDYVVRLSVYDSAGVSRPAPPLRGPASDLAGLGCQIGLEVLRIAAPAQVTDYQCIGGLTSRNVRAVRAFLAGEEAFQRDAWPAAERHYRDALVLDTGFALARWRLANVDRWRRIPSDIDVRRLYQERSADFGDLDRLLMQAELAPRGRQRFAFYEEALRRYPHDGYAALLYGSELMHRGALAGVALDSAAGLLNLAAQRDRYSARTLSHLAWTLIRLGERDSARVVLDRLRRSAARASETDFSFPAFLEFAFVERFDPANAPSLRAGMLGDPKSTSPEFLRMVRWAPTVDIPDAEAALGEIVLAAPAAPVRVRAEAHEARGLGLFATGRPDESLGDFDSVASLLGTDEARVQAAGWRVIPGVVGMPGIPATERARGVEMLRALLRRPSVGERAAWMLMLDAIAPRSGDQRVRELLGMVNDSSLRTLAEAVWVTAHPDDGSAGGGGQAPKWRSMPR